MNKFPLVVDDTILSTYGACAQKCNLAYMQHWKSKVESDHLVAGAAYADGLEALRNSFYIQGNSVDDSLAHAMISAVEKYGEHTNIDARKSLDRVLAALVHYVNQFNPKYDEFKPITIQGRPGIEFSFAIPIPHPDGGEILHPETNDPILYVGRNDAIVANNDGYTYILDDKTCTQLGATWASKWRLRSQFTGYYWGAQEYGIPTQGVIIRGMCFYQAIKPESGDIYVCKQVISERTKHDVEVWLKTTQRRLLGLLQDWKTDSYNYNLGDTCNSYGGCPFENICISKHPENWLRSGFVRKIWNPIERRVEPIEE